MVETEDRISVPRMFLAAFGLEVSGLPHFQETKFYVRCDDGTGAKSSVVKREGEKRKEEYWLTLVKWGSSICRFVCLFNFMNFLTL